MKIGNDGERTPVRVGLSDSVKRVLIHISFKGCYCTFGDIHKCDEGIRPRWDERNTLKGDKLDLFDTSLTTAGNVVAIRF